MSPEITAEDYRIAVKVMRYGVGGCGSSSYAGSWTREADRLEAAEAEAAYVLELAKHMAATAHPNMRWDEWTSGTPGSFQDGFITEARACLAKLEADGRLSLPAFANHPYEAWEDGYNAAVYDRSKRDSHGTEGFVYTKNPYKSVAHEGSVENAA
jgi:hypothetical protein